MAAGEGQPEYHALFKELACLILKAKEHHEAGRYDASIPLIQNQMEGIVMDVATDQNPACRPPSPGTLTATAAH